MKCSIDRRQLLVIVVAVLAVTAVPASVVSASDHLDVVSEHSTDGDFNAATTLDNVSVEGTGSSASVILKSLDIVDDFEDGDLSEWSGDTAPFDVNQTHAFGGDNSVKYTADGNFNNMDRSIPNGSTRVSWHAYYEANNDIRPIVHLREESTQFGRVGIDDGTETSDPGSVIYYNGTNWLDTGIDVTADAWYGFRVQNADVDAGTYDLEVVDANGDTVGTASDLEAENTVSQLTRIALSGKDGDFWIDRIAAGENPDTGQYVSADHDASETVEGWTSLTLTNATATVEWQAHDGSQWVVVNSTTFSSSGNKSLDISGTDYSRWRVNVTFDRDGSSADAELHDEGLLFEASDPSIDNSSASPSGGETVSETPVQLSINVSDEDFATSQGDNVSVTFYDASDDTEIGNETLSSNGTASASWDDPGLGEHQWYAVAEDDYGGTTTSDTFVFETPHELEIRDEENPSELINDTTTDVTVTFFGSDEVFERTTSTGVVDLSGLPDEQLIVSVDAEGYVTRQVVIDSITEQQTAYLLNESAASVDIRFRLEDPTGQFTESNSQLFVERPIQRNGTTTYRTIAGDEIGQGGYPVTLANDQRYRLILRNNQGDERALTGFMTQKSETVTLEVESVEYQFDTDNQPYKWTASYENETSEIDVAYTDKDDLTSSLTVRIIEQQNDTTVYENVWSDPSEVSTTVGVNGNETSTWLVQLEVDRDGDTFELETVVGQAQFPIVGDLDEDWQHRIAVALVFVLAGLFGVANASVGALVASLSTGILWVIGWMPPSVGAPMIFVGMTIASLFYVQDSGGGIQ